MVDVSGLYVTPGLIDAHVHVFATTGMRDAWAGDNSVLPDEFSFRTGVTTMVTRAVPGGATSKISDIELRKFWETHRVMREREYYHLENLCNLHEIPPPYHSFIVSVLPVKWRGASAAPVRAVAIVDR